MTTIIHSRQIDEKSLSSSDVRSLSSVKDSKPSWFGRSVVVYFGKKQGSATIKTCSVFKRILLSVLQFFRLSNSVILSRKEVVQILNNRNQQVVKIDDVAKKSVYPNHSSVNKDSEDTPLTDSLHSEKLTVTEGLAIKKTLQAMLQKGAKKEMASLPLSLYQYVDSSPQSEYKGFSLMGSPLYVSKVSHPTSLSSTSLYIHTLDADHHPIQIFIDPKGNLFLQTMDKEDQMKVIGSSTDPNHTFFKWLEPQVRSLIQATVTLNSSG